MYSEEFRSRVMNYYYNISHSEAKTADNFNIGKTTVSQWKLEDEGLRPKSVNRSNGSNEVINVDNFNSISIVTETKAETSSEIIVFKINDYLISISVDQLPILLKGLKND